MPGLIDKNSNVYYNNENLHGEYQFVSLNDIINQFIIGYVGQDKIISRVKRYDVSFHAHRALAELSFDTFKSCKAQEITVPNTLQMILPQDYVNYVKISQIDDLGQQHRLYPTSLTSKPRPLHLNEDGDNKVTATGTWKNVAGSTSMDGNVLVLDDFYPFIIPGLTRIRSNSLSVQTPGKDFVWSHQKNSDGKSQLKFFDGVNFANGFGGGHTFAGGTSAAPTEFSEDIQIFQSNRIPLIYEDSIALESASIVKDTYVIVANSESDAENIKVGMRVGTHLTQSAPFNTLVPVVTGVNGKYITIDVKATDDYTSTSTNLFLFSQENLSKDYSYSTSWNNYKTASTTDRSDIYWNEDLHYRYDDKRYGLHPQFAQRNGSYYIDCDGGKIHFSSGLSGQTIVLEYISDSLGTDKEMKVPKLAEEAMYKWIAHAILSTRSNIPEYVIMRYKKEKRAAVRNAKLRLSNIKLEEITQILRGKSKWIKH
tara:strand:+ start:950 stop:2395 length:1446 start_codon:yes stop_codon:yes gene_type:complete